MMIYNGMVPLSSWSNTHPHLHPQEVTSPLYTISPDDELQRDGTSVLMLNQFEMQMYVEQQEKATYTEQANKRAHCRRLTSFIRLKPMHFYFHVFATLHSQSWKGLSNEKQASAQKKMNV